MLTKITDSGEYLNITQLKEGQEYKKLCYVSDVRAGITVYQDGYYTFYVRDYDGNTVAARMFQVKDFEEAGFDAMYLKGKPAEITFTAQIYNGAWSCLLHNISVFSGEFDFRRFRGVAPDTDDAFLREVYGKDVWSQYRSKTLSRFCDGRVGGVTKIFEICTKTLYGFSDMVDKKRLLSCFQKAFHFLVLYEENKEEFGIVTGRHVAQLLQPMLDDEDSDCLVDTCYAVIGMKRADNLYTHLITRALDSAMEASRLIYLERALPYGSTVQVNGGTLTKY